LTGFGGFLASIKLLDVIGFQEIFQFAFRPPLREPKLGHYRMVVGVLMLLNIGFNRIWHFVYVRLDALLCGFFGLSGCRRPARFGDTWTVWGSIRDRSSLTVVPISP